MERLRQEAAQASGHFANTVPVLERRYSAPVLGRREPACNSKLLPRKSPMATDCELSMDRLPSRFRDWGNLSDRLSILVCAGPDGDGLTGSVFFGNPHRKGGSAIDRKSTRLNSSHANISYAVF